jgi:hypothetical protein
VAKGVFCAIATASLVAAAIVSACDGYGESTSEGAPVDAAADGPPILAGDAGDASSDACAANVDEDPKNCGRCGHDCLGGGCSSGRCQPVSLVDWDLVDDKCTSPEAGSCFTGTIASVVVDDTWAYFSDYEPSLRRGGLLRVKKDVVTQQKPEPITSVGAIRRLGADVTSFLWLRGNTVERIARTGGAVEVLSSMEADSKSASAPLRVGNDVLFGTRDGVRRLTIGASGVSVEAFPDAGGIGDVVALAASADGSLLVWATTDGMITSRENGSHRVVAVQQSVTFLTLDDHRVYWTNGDGSVYSSDLAFATSVPTLHAKTDVNPTDIVVDGDDLYVTTWGKNVNTAQGIVGSVFRMPKQPPFGTLHVPDAIFQGPILVSDLAIDERAIYFAGWFSPTVLRLAK